MEIKHYDRVRGGNNSYALFHLSIGGDQSASEVFALVGDWLIEAGFDVRCSRYDNPLEIEFNTREQFAVLPALLRKLSVLEITVATSQWDTGMKGRAYMDSLDFWKALALAQAFLT